MITVGESSAINWTPPARRFAVRACALTASACLAATMLCFVNHSRAGITITQNELSGVAVFDGGLLIADDELVGSVIRIEKEPSPEQLAQPLAGKLLKIERKRKASQPNTSSPKLAAVQDIEGIASDGHRRLVFIGSHNSKDGNRRTDREFIIQARWEDDELVWDGEYRNLAERLASVLAPAGAKLTVTKTTIQPDLDIEGVALHGDVVFIGLRAPLDDKNRALIVSAKRTQLFDGTAEPEFDVHAVDLEGGGIRGLEWDDKTNKLLILSGSSNDSGQPPAALWLWGVQSRTPEKLHSFTAQELGGANQRAPEAVTVWNDRILVGFDGPGSDSGLMILPHP